MSDEAPTEVPDDRATWAARFGWILGALLGTTLGFVATWLLETRVLQGKVPDPTATATRASSVVVPLMFLAGALAGHAFGARGGAGRYRLLAMSAGTMVAVALWAVLVIVR